MLISTFEYKALFKDRPINSVSNRDIEIARQNAQQNSPKEKSSFHTWNDIGVTYDEYGTPKISIIEKTGFEMNN